MSTPVLAAPTLSRAVLAVVLLTLCCAASASAAGGPCQNQKHPVNCGWDGITVDQCDELDCCWNEATKTCSYHLDGVPVRKVHFIQSNHFDAGYADLTVNVINMYFDTFFPRAYTVAKQLHDRNGTEQLR